MKEVESLAYLQQGQVKPIYLSTAYHKEPLNAFLSLRQERGEHILLESAEVDSRENLKSLLMVDPSLRIVCTGQSVTVTALTESGEQLLAWLVNTFKPKLESPEPKGPSVVFTFPSVPENLDESARLQFEGSADILRALQLQLDVLEESEFTPLLAGVFAYDYLGTFESLPEVEQGPNTCSDYQFYLTETLMVIDHKQEQATLIGTLAGGDNTESRYQSLCKRMGEILAKVQMPELQHTEKVNPSCDIESLQVSPSDDEYLEMVTELKEAIADGDIFQVVPSRSFQLRCTNALRSYAQLKKDNPSPYMFYIQADEFELFGASPESALKYQAHSRQAELYPIAGTRPRAKNKNGSINLDQDARTELSLRMDHKEMAEHMMLVDLARNDLARVGVPGTRYVADLLKVDRYSHVMHLVSRVVTTLKDELDALDAYRACMNMGTLVGAPKLSAARYLRKYEKKRRGSYGGAVGYLSGNGDMDTCIVIRSAYVQNGVATIQAGAGVVHDSDPRSELNETVQKAAAVINAIQTVEIARKQKELNA